jgi:hypothetical protein
MTPIVTVFDPDGDVLLRVVLASVPRRGDRVTVRAGARTHDLVVENARWLLTGASAEVEIRTRRPE